MGVCLLCLCQIVLGMRQARCFQLATGCDHLQPILPDRLQHVNARTLRILFGPVKEVLVQQGGHAVKDLCQLAAKGMRHMLHCFQGSAPHKDCEHTEHPLFLKWQEGIRPGKGVAQRLLASRQIPRPVG